MWVRGPNVYHRCVMCFHEWVSNTKWATLAVGTVATDAADVATVPAMRGGENGTCPEGQRRGPGGPRVPLLQLQGEESMLSLTLYNLGSHPHRPEWGDYEFWIRVNGEVIERGFVDSHERKQGWRALVRQVVDRPEPMGKVSITWDDDARISRDGV